MRGKTDTKIIIFETTVLHDGIGDYYHLRDCVVAARTNPNLAHYLFIPVIRTSDLKLKIQADFLSLKVTQYYVGSHDEFSEDSELDQQLQPIYARAEQVIVVSHGGSSPQWRHLNPAVVIKKVLEHEYSKDLFWEFVSNRPTLQGSFGLQDTALGIKIPKIQRQSPVDFFARLEQFDTPFAEKLKKRLTPMMFPN